MSFGTMISEYTKIKDLTINQMRELQRQKNNRKLTEDEEQQLQKYYFMILFDTKIDPHNIFRSSTIQGIIWSAYKKVNPNIDFLKLNI